MTRPNFREGHPSVPWNPNLVGHQQKRVGKKVHESLDERVKAIQEEIAKMKPDQDNSQNPLSSNP